MSVIINGMEMPINCTRCPCSDDETRFCNAAKKYIPMHGKPKFCPLATIEERKTSEWLHEYLQTAVDFGIITETHASRLMDMIDDSEDNT